VCGDRLAGADRIGAGGCDPVELISPWCVTTPVMHLDTTPNTDQVYASAHELAGHVGAILGWITAHWSGEPRWAETEVAAHRARLRAAWLDGRAEGALNPSDVVSIALEAAPSYAIVTTDVGSHKIMAGQAWPATEPRSVLIPNGLSAMGFGVPAAIAARLTRPDRPVLALTGDGGFNMLMGEFLTAVHHNLPVKVIIFNNSAFGLITLEAESVGLPPFRKGIEFPNPDFAAFARACGGHGFAARKPGELKAAISEAFAVDGPAIVDAVVAADEIPNLPHVDLDTIGHFALAKIKEAVLAVTGVSPSLSEKEKAPAASLAQTLGVDHRCGQPPLRVPVRGGGPDHGRAAITGAVDSEPIGVHRGVCAEEGEGGLRVQDPAVGGKSRLRSVAVAPAFVIEGQHDIARPGQDLGGVRQMEVSHASIAVTQHYAGPLFIRCQPVGQEQVSRQPCPLTIKADRPLTAWLGMALLPLLC